MPNNNNLTDEQIKELESQKDALGEVISQCWESEEFKKTFIENPLPIFEEYGVKYDPSKTYKVIEAPEKTIVNVLPYENCKPAFEMYAKRWAELVENIEGEEGKQILLEDWSWKYYQNTENVNYIVIPISPDSLSPDELEMINGGCIIFGPIFIMVGAVLVALVGFDVFYATYAAVYATAKEVTGTIVIANAEYSVIAVDEDGHFYSGINDYKKPKVER